MTKDDLVECSKAVDLLPLENEGALWMPGTRFTRYTETKATECTFQFDFIEHNEVLLEFATHFQMANLANNVPEGKAEVRRRQFVGEL